MNKENIAFVVLAISVIFTTYIVQNTIQSQLEFGCTKDVKELDFPMGERVYSPEYKLYGVVDSLRDDCSILGINWDNAWYSQQGVSDYIKVKNSTYLQIQDFPNYPSPVMKYYNIQWAGWYGNDAVNAQDSREVKEYCEETYGNGTFKDKHTCRTSQENDTEVRYSDYGVNAKIMTIWRLQHTLDNKSNLNTTKLVLEPNQEVLVYTPIDYTLLRGWLDYYGLTYNSRNLSVEDFDEIKHNIPFMSEYCSVYGYTGYDGRACYRVSNFDESGKMPVDPCANPKSEAVASACVKIMEARFAKS